MDFELTDEQVALHRRRAVLPRGPLPDRRGAVAGRRGRRRPRPLAGAGRPGRVLPAPARGRGRRRAGLGRRRAGLRAARSGARARPAGVDPPRWPASSPVRRPATRSSAASSATIPARLVEYPDGIDVLVVADDDGPLDASTPSALELSDRRRPLDPLTPVARLVGPPAAGRADRSTPRRPHDLHVQGAALTAGLLLGLAEAATDLAVAYAKERQQFGRPIGVVPEPQAPDGRHVRPRRGGPRRGLRRRRDPRRPGRRLGRAGGGGGQAHRGRGRRWPTARRASRCTAAWATRGRSTPTCSSSGPTRSSRASAPATTGPTPWPTSSTHLSSASLQGPPGRRCSRRGGRGVTLATWRCRPRS